MMMLIEAKHGLGDIVRLKTGDDDDDYIVTIIAKHLNGGIVYTLNKGPLVCVVYELEIVDKDTVII